MTTRLYTHEIFVEHLTPPGHPERPDRLKAIAQALSHDRFSPLQRMEAPRADEAVYLSAHRNDYVRQVKGMSPETGIVQLDPDTAMSPKTWDCVARAVGAANDAIDAVFTGEADNAFIAARPPGHHAEKSRAMGFCLINTAAVAARHAQKEHGAERVAIIDWDVHHGNGTQDIFWDDPSVLYASTHEMPLFPGTGAAGEVGAGNIVNAPLSAGMGGDEFRQIFEARILSAVEAFEPDVVIVSAGFDAHRRDPLANIQLEAEDFDWATGKVMDIAAQFCDNRLVSLLEGGYDLQGLAESCAAHVSRLMRG